MQLRALTFFLLFFFFVSLCGKAVAQVNKETIYYALSSEDTGLLNSQLEILKENAAADKEAYQGALLMKKAGLSVNPAEKLELFRKGKALLEKKIKDNNLNAEFRFLRLMIQEHAPKIMNYYSDIEADKEIILRSFKKLPAEVRQAIVKYSKKSKVLKLEE